MAEFEFTTTCEAKPRLDLKTHEIFALLDWCFGNLTEPQTKDYGRTEAAYPSSLRTAAEAAGSREDPSAQ